MYQNDQIRNLPWQKFKSLGLVSTCNACHADDATIRQSLPVDSEPERKGNLNVRAITWVAGGEGGGAGEVAGGALGLVVLVVAVGRPGAVRGDVVGVVARPVLMDGVAVRPRAAGVVDGLLQRGLRRILPAHAPFCTRTWQKKEKEKNY